MGVFEWSVTPDVAFDMPKIEAELTQKIGVTGKIYVQLIRRSLDARKSPPVYQIKVAWQTTPFINSDYSPESLPVKDLEALVIGSGPAGLFAALTLIKHGIKPILIERGKDVRARRRDLAAMTREGIVNPDSNYCFGEGGAGTYSDGKLYTRSSKRGNIEEVLKTFVYFGANADILVDAHPHIGTNNLPAIIQNIRSFILEKGGEFHFQTRMTRLLLEDHQIKGAEMQNGKTIKANYLILATGHSARDVFTLLHQQQIAIEAKPFALGVRIEHPQAWINRIQYRNNQWDEILPPASYTLVAQSKGRGVFSFCMCPGGIIAPAATAPGEIVVNGWSPSKRNNPKANSGLVVSIEKEDFKPWEDDGPLAGMGFQSHVEQKAFQAGGGFLKAPAQSVIDFMAKRDSEKNPDSSYLPGTTPCNLWEVLPEMVSTRLAEGLHQFSQKMRGYLHPEAVLLATESRTSSPVRIPRDPQTCQHPEINGLYPCGEGAGYAGGIVSAAMDGMRCAEALAKLVNPDAILPPGL